MTDKNSLNRRTVLIAAATVPLMAVGTARAAGLPPAAVSYQTSPKDGKKCSDCNFFIAPASCKSVSGEISPDGWCKLWVKKPA